MDWNKADRIIVTSNARMQMVIDWWFENKDWLTREEFRAPMELGIIELREEGLKVQFRSKDETLVELAVAPLLKPNLPPVLTFDYNPHTMVASNYRFPSHLSEARRETLRSVLQFDRTDAKEALKYHSLMQFMTYYREVVEIEERAEKPAVPKRQHKAGKRKKHSQPLIRRSYILPDVDSTKLEKPEWVKRKYTKPDHEVNVRGHLRRYKSGKTVWVKPSVRYKGENNSSKEYRL